LAKQKPLNVVFQILAVASPYPFVASCNIRTPFISKGL